MIKLLLRFRKYLYINLGNSNIAATGLTTLIIITGVWGSLYSNEIKKILPFTFLFYSNSYAPYGFWLLVLLTTILFFIRQKAQEQIIQERTDQLYEAIRTVPPADFLITFQTLFSRVTDVKRLFLANPVYDKDSLEKLVRTILNAVLGLIERFDKYSDSTEYGVNAMIYVESNNFKQLDEKKVKNILTFIEKECDVNELKGVLILKPELSVSSTSRGELDKNLIEFALPIPYEHLTQNNKGIDLWRVLPGAPIAFVKNEVSSFSDKLGLLEWCNNYGDFTENVKLQLEKYFFAQEKTYLKSFVSIPLPNRKDSVRGVINIHSNKKGMLKNEENLKQFSIIMSPLLHDLIDVLDIYFNGKNGKQLLLDLK